MGNGKVMTVIVISVVHFQFGFLVSSIHTCIFIMCAFKALSFLMFVCVYGQCLPFPYQNVFHCTANHTPILLSILAFILSYIFVRIFIYLLYSFIVRKKCIVRSCSFGVSIVGGSFTSPSYSPTINLGFLG